MTSEGRVYVCVLCGSGVCRLYACLGVLRLSPMGVGCMCAVCVISWCGVGRRWVVDGLCVQLVLWRMMGGGSVQGLRGAQGVCLAMSSIQCRQ